MDGQVLCCSGRPPGFKRHLYWWHKQTTFKMAILEGVHKGSWNDLLNQRVVANPEQLGIWASVNVGDIGILGPQHP